MDVPSSTLPFFSYLTMSHLSVVGFFDLKLACMRRYLWMPTFFSGNVLLIFGTSIIALVHSSIIVDILKGLNCQG